MHKLFSGISLALLCCSEAFASESIAHSKVVSRYIESIEQEKGAQQGGVIAIVSKGEVIYKSAFGFKNEDKDPITYKTMFALASVSKAISATSVARLVEKGAIDLDEEVMIDELNEKFSIRHILGNTTGYALNGNKLIEQGVSRSGLLKELTQLKKTCHPGKCYFYSNLAFSLVDEALQARKSSLQDALAGLSKDLNTDGIKLASQQMSWTDVAYPHKKKSGHFKALPFPKYYPKAVPAAAGVFASLDGMIEVLKLNMGYKKEVISSATLAKFHAPLIRNSDIKNWVLNWPISKDNIESFYGLGWRVLKPKKPAGITGPILVFHSGYINGANAFIGFMPEIDIGLIILVNQNSIFATQKGIDFWGGFVH